MWGVWGAPGAPHPVMQRYAIRRVALTVPTLFFVSVIVFVMMRMMPGDVAMRMVEGHAYAPTLEALRRDLGLDRPMYVQYVDWIGGIVTRGDFGRSYWTRQPIIEEFLHRFPVTLELALLTILVSVVIGVTVGIVAAARQDTVADYTGRVLAILALSVPYFGLAVLVVVLPSIWFRWTPVWTYVPFTTDPLENLKIMAVPALVFGVTRAGPIMRIMRSALLDVLRQEYIRTAWSKGLSERRIILRHALKNALIPVISLVGLQMPLYIGGSVIIEAIFRLPGVGLFFFEALGKLDYPVVQSVNLIIAAMVVGLNLLIDLSYAFLDPRIRYR
jgi:peptide/nickel transport system permease protein